MCLQYITCTISYFLLVIRTKTSIIVRPSGLLQLIVTAFIHTSMELFTLLALWVHTKPIYHLFNAIHAHINVARLAALGLCRLSRKESVRNKCSKSMSNYRNYTITYYNSRELCGLQLSMQPPQCHTFWLSGAVARPETSPQRLVIRTLPDDVLGSEPRSTFPSERRSDRKGLLHICIHPPEIHLHLNNDPVKYNQHLLL